MLCLVLPFSQVIKKEIIAFKSINCIVFFTEMRSQENGEEAERSSVFVGV